ncbi:MAG TPA: ClbS/DfsB family four-helix bundle protein [Methylomirabilota bacterium]|jgi:hypothetical protein
MGAKQDLLSEAAAAYTELREAADSVPDSRMTETWLGSWGAREILVHISGWHREMIPAFQRIARGQAPFAEGVSYDDFDAWNARFVEATRGVKVADVRAELTASHHDFVTAASALADEHLAPGGAAHDLFTGAGPAHYREHANQIREWRAR